MALTVATNTGALMAQAAASSVNKDMELSMERLATGKRINSASDDPAGVAIASRLTSEIKGTNQAIRNAMDGQAMLDTAEGAHVEVESILQRMRELAVQASNGTNDANDRTNIQSEMDQLRTEIDRIAQTTSWAGQNLLDGSAAGKATAHTDRASFTFQVGSGTTSSDAIVASIGAITADALGVGGATSKPTVANVASTGGSATTATLNADGTITMSGTVAAGNTVSLNVNGTSHTLTVAADEYTLSGAGVASQLSDEINALGLAGVSTSASGAVVSFNAGAAVERPVVTSSVTATGASGTIAETSANSVVTFGGDFNNGDTYTMTANGITQTITASNTDQFEDNSKGLAAQMAAAFDTLMHAADTAVVAGSISADQLKLAGTSVTDNGDGTITFAQDANVFIASPSATHSDNANTLTKTGNNEITMGAVGTFVVSDADSVTINGETVTYTSTANDGFDNATIAGHAAGLASAISENADLKAAGYSASAALGVITISRDALDLNSLSTTATGGIATLAEGTGANAGTFTVGGNIDNGDKFSMVIDGTTVEATISTTDGHLDTTGGAAQQIAQAITDANISGVTATYNDNTATFTLEKSGSLSVSSTASAQLTVEFLDQAIQTINSQRANLGAVSNRLDSTVSNLTNISSNLQAGRGRIEDADFAAETTSLAKSQILQQASTAMLAQANASKQNVLSLLQG